MQTKNPVLGLITLGSDPEVLVKKDNIPWGAAVTGISGTKSAPSAVSKGAIQIDGMALEFNIDPALTADDWMEHHQKVLSVITQRAKASGLVMVKESLLDYSHYIETQKPSDEETLFGCEPDHNADTMQENVMPDNDGSILYRTAGAHVHIGMSNWDAVTGGDEEMAHRIAQRIIYICDVVLGLWSVLHDDGAERKKLYGKAGAYRLKPYGVEYRTLSNFWVFNDELMRKVYTRLTAALANMDEFQRIFDYATDNRHQIIHAINNNDRDLAVKLLNEVGLND